MTEPTHTHTHTHTHTTFHLGLVRVATDTFGRDFGIMRARCGLDLDKEPACNAGDPSFILKSGKSPGKENGNPLQYSCLDNYMDRGACRSTVHGLAESRTPLSD